MQYKRFGWGIVHVATDGIPGPDSMVYEGSPLDADDNQPPVVGASEPAADPVGDDHSEPAETGPEPASGVDSASPDGFNAEPLADDPDIPAEHSSETIAPPDFGGVLVSGDPLKAAQMEATWRVGELEAEKVGEYDLPENARRLAELRSLALAAKEGAAPDLTEAQKEELHALETFDGWLSRIRTYADNLRDAIRKVESADALAWINLEQGWPE